MPYRQTLKRLKNFADGLLIAKMIGIDINRELKTTKAIIAMFTRLQEEEMAEMAKHFDQEQE